MADNRDDMIADIEVNSEYSRETVIEYISYIVVGNWNANIADIVNFVRFRGDSRYETYSRYRREPDILEKESND